MKKRYHGGGMLKDPSEPFQGFGLLNHVLPRTPRNNCLRLSKPLNGEIGS